MTTQIKSLSRDQKIIPIYFARGAYQTTNVRPPDLVLTNGYDHPVTIEQVDILCSGGGTELAVFRIPGERLRPPAQEATRTLQDLSRTEAGRFRIGLLHGDLTVAPADLALDPLPGCPVLLPIADVVSVEYTGFERLDSMELVVRYRRSGAQDSVCLSVPMIDYRCRGPYRFPLRRHHRLYHTTNPVASLTGHRRCRAEAFAIDMVAAHQGRDGRLTTRSRASSIRARDYLIFGEEVQAIGEGVVVGVSNLFPDALLGTIGEGYDAHRKQVLARMSARFGGRVAMSGNHLVIDHENGEFSQYCHLMEDSIPVKPGDRVGQGHVIGRVGNTGNSAVPHLHLQLMDGPDEATANGLPVLFQDIDAQEINDEIGENCNTLMFSPFLYFTLQEG